MNQACARAEILAGAIALGEATEPDRDEYRRHIAACSPCLTAIGGEREIERTMDVVGRARTSEVWEPVLSNATAQRRRSARAWGWGLSATAVAITASLAIHAFVAAQLRPLAVAQRSEVVSSQPFVHVTIEHRSTAQPVAALPKARVDRPSIVVVHNVITLKHPNRVEPPPSADRPQTTVVAESISLKTQSNIPVWRRDEAMPSPDASPQDQASTAPIMQGRAESIAVAPSYVIRDVEPVGGDTAINPRPPMLAYDIGAEGTTAFEVSVDERGAPVKCTITKSSGYLVLDAAVCRAAMKAKYSPRTVNGRAVAGVYRDAFTFRSENNSDNQF